MIFCSYIELSFFIDRKIKNEYNMSQTLDGTRQLCKEGEKKLLNNQFFAYTSACTDQIRQHFYINSSFFILSLFFVHQLCIGSFIGP